jgi:dihydroorotate dehydrogenase electron transfer subunit
VSLAPARFSALPLIGRDDFGNGYFVLRFASEQPMDGRAGQFAMLRGATWGSAPLLPRPMSLLSAGREPTVLIKVVGEGTRHMAAAAIGESFDVLAPLGKSWTAPAQGETAVMVAGGVGVAPLLFFAEELASSGIEAHCLYGGRSSRDLPLSDRLARVARLEVSTEDGSRGTTGRVTVLLERLLASTRGPTKIYTCGPHPMMAAVAKLAERFGVPCDASLEAPMGCGYGVCLGCPVARRGGGYLYTCVDGPCVDAGAIDWSKDVF